MAGKPKHPGDYLQAVDENFPFIGRDKEQARFTKILCKKSTCIFMLKGHPSAGKTRTAKEVVRAALHVHQKENVKARAYFISAQESQNMTKVKLELANQCGCMTTVAECPNMQNVCSAARLMADKYKIYFLLDNVEDLLPDHQTELMKMCTDLVEINSTHQIVVVLTSRVELQFPRLTKEQFIMAELEPLAVSDAVTFLRLVCDSSNESEDDEECLLDPVCLEEDLAVKLVKLLGRLPLAILTVGSMLRARDYTPEEALELALDPSTAGGVLKLADDRFADSDRLEIILKIYMGRIQTFLQEQLAQINYIPGGFKPDVVAALQDTSVALAKKMVINPLKSRSVISWDKRSQRIYISPPIKEFVEKNLSDKRDEKVTRAKFCQYFCKDLKKLLTDFDKAPEKSMERLAEDYLNFEKSLKVADCKAEISFSQCLELMRTGESVLVQMFPQCAIDFIQRLCENSCTEGTLTEQAEVNMALGGAIGNISCDHEAAELQLDEAKKIVELCEGNIPERLVAKLLHHMGYNLFSRNQWQEAIDVLNKSQALLGEDGLTRLAASNECILGLLHTKLGNHSQAEHHHLKAIDTRMKLHGEHLHIGQAYNNLGLVYANQGDWDRAFSTFLKGLEMKEKFTKGISSSTICASLYNVANGYYYKGDIRKAIETAEKALKMRDELGWSHPLTSALLKNMGKYHLKLGNLKNAKKYSKDALEMRKEKEGVSIGVAGSMKYYADVLTACEEYREAEQLYFSALEMDDKVLVDLPKNFGRADTYKELIILYQKCGNPQKVEEYSILARQEFLRLRCCFEDCDGSPYVLARCKRNLCEIENLRNQSGCQVESTREPCENYDPGFNIQNFREMSIEDNAKANVTGSEMDNHLTQAKEELCGASIDSSDDNVSTKSLRDDDTRTVIVDLPTITHSYTSKEEQCLCPNRQSMSSVSTVNLCSSEEKKENVKDLSSFVSGSQGNVTHSLTNGGNPLFNPVHRQQNIPVGTSNAFGIYVSSSSSSGTNMQHISSSAGYNVRTPNLVTPLTVTASCSTSSQYVGGTVSTATVSNSNCTNVNPVNTLPMNLIESTPVDHENPVSVGNDSSPGETAAPIPLTVMSLTSVDTSAECSSLHQTHPSSHPTQPNICGVSLDTDHSLQPESFDSMTATYGSIVGDNRNDFMSNIGVYQGNQVLTRQSDQGFIHPASSADQGVKLAGMYQMMYSPAVNSPEDGDSAAGGLPCFSQLVTSADHKNSNVTDASATSPESLARQGVSPTQKMPEMQNSHMNMQGLQTSPQNMPQLQTLPQNMQGMQATNMNMLGLQTSPQNMPQLQTPQIRPELQAPPQHMQGLQPPIISTAQRHNPPCTTEQSLSFGAGLMLPQTVEDLQSDCGSCLGSGLTTRGVENLPSEPIADLTVQQTERAMDSDMQPLTINDFQFRSSNRIDSLLLEDGHIVEGSQGGQRS